MNIRNFFLFYAILAFCSCRFISGQRINGNGHLVTQDKSVGNFNSIKTGGSMNVHLSIGSAQSLKIQADENLMQYINIYTEGNTLIVRTKEGFDLNPTHDVVIYATAPIFKDIDVSGSGDIVSDNTITGNQPINMQVSGSGNINVSLEVPKVSTDISGSGDVQLKGHAQDFTAGVSGSGKVKCFDLVTDNTTLDLSGASDAEVFANKKLDISVSGSGTVRYKGTASVSQHISGSGDVQKVN